MGTENVIVSFFLFGDVNKEHWKTQTGTVIALLNPSIMKKNKVTNVYTFSFNLTNDGF